MISAGSLVLNLYSRARAVFLLISLHRRPRPAALDLDLNQARLCLDCIGDRLEAYPAVPYEPEGHREPDRHLGRHANVSIYQVQF